MSHYGSMLVKYWRNGIIMKVPPVDEQTRRVCQVEYKVNDVASCGSISVACYMSACDLMHTSIDQVLVGYI